MSPLGPRCWDAALVCISTNSVSLNSWTKFPRHPWKVSMEVTKESTSLHIEVKDVTVPGQFICGSQLCHGKCWDLTLDSVKTLQVLLGSAEHLFVQYNSRKLDGHVSFTNRPSEDRTTAHLIIWCQRPFMLRFTQANLAKSKRWRISKLMKFKFFLFPLSTS